MKTVQFEEATYIDFVNWASENKIIFKKIANHIKDIDRNGENIGIGKPEPLKHNLAGYWTRRITDEHRLVYKIENEIIVIVQCKGHYK
jgi:toxin YoeB